jgi:hypothetical protein
MTERISELLNEAVAGVEPAHPDPVGAVLRRRRTARRASALTAAVACVGLSVGGAVAVQQLKDPPRRGVAATDPPVPYIDGDTVVAGTLRFPIPDGWQAVTSDQPCRDPDHTVLIDIPGGERCELGAVEIRGNPQVLPLAGMFHRGGSSIKGSITRPPAMVTLPGGEPAWLSDREGLDVAASQVPEGRGFLAGLLLPWSQVGLTFRVDGPTTERFLASMSNNPAGAGALALPGTAARAEMTVTDARGGVGSEDFGAIEGAGPVARVLDLLREQEDVVSDSRACAGHRQRTIEIVFSELAENPPIPEGTRIPATPRTVRKDVTAVVVALGDGCQEAVSNRGGRVRLDDDTVVELGALFGIRLR